MARQPSRRSAGALSRVRINRAKPAHELRTCIRAFDHIPPRRGGRMSLNRWWENLLDQCQASWADGVAKPLGDLTYCGYTYARPLPWSDEY
jgi:hypothetical protein